MKSWLKAIAIFTVSLVFSLTIHLPGNSQLNSSDLIQKAQSSYNQELYQESLTLLETAEQNFIQDNQILKQAQIQSLISLTQQQLGNWDKAQEKIDYGLALISTYNDSPIKKQVLAKIWNAQGQLYFNSSKVQEALSAWETASQLYQTSGDVLGEKGANINRAQALESLGFLRRACQISLENLGSDITSCEDLGDEEITILLNQINFQSAPWEIKGLSTIGNTLFLMGRLSSAQTVFENSLTFSARSLQLKNKILLNLAKVHQAKAIQAKEQKELDIFKQEFQQALNFYQQIFQSDSNNTLFLSDKLEAKLNQLNLLIFTKQLSLAQQIVQEIQFSFDSLPLNKRSIAVKLNFARSLTNLKQNETSLNYSWLDIAQIYTQIIEDAETLDAPRIAAAAYGYLGQLAFEQNLQLKTEPRQLLTTALNLSQSTNAPEIAYRWQWQLGRIYRQEGNNNQAIGAYQAAFANLQNLRSDLIALNREIQFSFRGQVEPVYRELTDLLLRKADISSEAEAQNNLAQARDVIEALQLAELDNYFQDACLVFEQKDIAEIDPYAATIYAIELPESLEVILNLPGGKLYHHSQSLEPEQLSKTINQFRRNLLDPSELLATQALSLEVYNWLIKPWETELNSHPQKIKTLVFVLDGILQNIPMSVLYDGNQYLLEKYAIAITPGLQLLNPQTTSDKFDKFSALVGGVSEQLQVSNKSFGALKNVPKELEIINSNFNSETLINDQFNISNLSQKLNSEPFSVVHLATHGQFSSNPEQTFILLWDRLLTLQNFTKLLQNRNINNTKLIDLLVLSACETAVGDDRAALGLAGMAVRTGASSTLATLWQVNDESTATLMANFYQQLSDNPGISKAEALRIAQLDLWKNTERDWVVPTFWGSYILVGNWQ